MSHHPYANASESGLNLDHLEALARAANPGPWKWWTSNSVLRLSAADGIDGGVLRAHSHRGHADICCGESDRAFITAANPAAVLALIALARRAQPEGEATQAAPLSEVQIDRIARAYFSEQWAVQHAKDAIHDAFEDARKSATLSPLCGAQHAESEDPIGEFQAEARQAKLEEAVSGWSRHAESGKEALMIEALKSCKASSFRGVDGDWVRSLHYDEGKVRVALAAQQAAAPGAQALLNAEEMAALHRFQETCQDFDSGGYDVDKNMMKRLAAIGVIESKGFGRYQFTDFGDFVIERAAQLDGGQERSESNG